MNKIIVVYASMTGNTEEMANYISEAIKEMGCEVDVKDSVSVTVKELIEYDGILIGSYTWDGLPDEIIDLYEELGESDLHGKKAAVFGSGDTTYGEDEYCSAVDDFVKQLKGCGAEVVLEGLKVELTPENEEIERCKEFGRKFVKTLE